MEQEVMQAIRAELESNIDAIIASICGENGGDCSPLFSYVQEQVVFNGLFHFPLLDADITLCDGGGAVLQKVLDEDDIVIVRPVYLRCVPLAKRMGADAVIAEIVTDFA